MPSLAPIQGVENISWRSETIQITATDALSVGKVVTLTLTAASGDTPAGYRSCALATAAKFTPNEIIGVALEACAANATAKIGLRGVFDVLCDTEVTAGALLSVSRDHAANLDLLAVPADDAVLATKPVGISLEESASDTDLVPVLFDGITGFASQASAES